MPEHICDHNYPSCGAGAPVARLEERHVSMEGKLDELKTELGALRVEVRELVTSLRAFRLVVGGAVTVVGLLIAAARFLVPGGAR